MDNKESIPACCESLHCYHVIGHTSLNDHGEYRPRHMLPETVFRCCQCGNYKAALSDRPINENDIIFNAGEESYADH